MSKIASVNPYQGELICPHCGGENLHQGTVEVFNRPIEDGPIQAVVLPPNAGPRNGTPSRNPSDRRQGLLIHFDCETCGERPRARAILEIYQHKGTTYLQWR